jgi:uncharacterized protein (TIRG00374 family)
MRKFLKYSISFAIALLFLWLAFRNVKFDELWESMGTISYWWVVPTAITMLISHYFRAERWRLVLEEKSYQENRLTLFTGVLVGYLVNYAFPRMGEVSRCVYVGKRENQSASALLGTVVLERILDLITLFILMVIAVIYVIADPAVIEQLFGKRTIEYLQELATLETMWSSLGYLVSGLIILAILVSVVYWLSQRISWLARLIDKTQEITRLFIQGVIAIKDVNNWWLFIGYTAIIWIGYVGMTFFPLWMLDLHSAYDITFWDAIAITAVVSIGIVLPSPGGVGTYHYFAKQSLLVLFAVPASLGLTYAVVTHAMLMLMIIVTTSLLLLWDRAVHGGGQEESLWDVVESTDESVAREL